MNAGRSGPGAWTRLVGGLWRYLGSQASTTAEAFRLPSLRMLVAAYFGYCLVRKSARVAILVYAFDVGGVRAASLVAVVQLLPAALIAPVGSALADRLHPVRALALGYLVQSVALAATGALMLVAAPLVATALASAVSAVAFTVTRPVHLATLPDVVERPQELTIGNAASAWVDGVASLVGPLLTAAGLATVGAGRVMLALSAVALVATGCALRIVIHRTFAPVGVTIRQSLRGGIDQLRGDRDAARLTALVSVQYAVVGLLDVLLVVLVVDVMGLPSATAGALGAGIGAGAVLGGVGSVALAGRPRLLAALLIGSIASGVPVALLGLGPGPVAAAGLLIGYGIGKSVFTVAAQTLLQRTLPDDVATRVFGVQEGMIQAGTAAGAAMGAAFVAVLGPPGALAVTGALLPLAVLVSRAAIGRLDRRAVVPGAAFDLLRAIPFLGMLPLRPLERLARSAEAVSVPAGETVLQQGDAGDDHYYAVRSGVAEVLLDGERVRDLGAGDGFGEIALLQQVPRTASVTARTDLELVRVDRDAFLAAVTGTEQAHRSAARTAAGHREADARRGGDAHGAD